MSTDLLSVFKHAYDAERARWNSIEDLNDPREGMTLIYAGWDGRRLWIEHDLVEEHLHDRGIRAGLAATSRLFFGTSLSSASSPIAVGGEAHSTSADPRCI